MEAQLTDVATPVRTAGPWEAVLRERWPLVLGLLLLIVPTLVETARDSWSTEMGAHGPIVLVTGIWLIARARGEILAARAPGNPVVAALMIVPALVVYVFGRAFDFLSLEVAAAELVVLGAFYLEFGAVSAARIWFPIVYLAFLIPIPGWFIDLITGPLKMLISTGATRLLQLFGYPVERQGVVLLIAQYQLLVEDACSGLRSLISLTAMSLFYIYLLHRASWRYALILMLWVVPMALLANLVRVILIVLLTYYQGEAAAQGILHPTAGTMMFVVALFGIFLVDKLMAPLRRRLDPEEAR